MNAGRRLKTGSSFFTVGRKRKKELLQLALLLSQGSKEEKANQEIHGDFWGVTTPCKTFHDVAPGVPFLTITGGGLTIHAVAPADAVLPWFYRWEIARGNDVLYVGEASSSEERRNTELLSQVEQFWPGDRIEGIMAASDLDVILKHYKYVLEDFTYVLQSLAIGGDFDEVGLERAARYGTRAIEAVEVLQSPEEFVSSLSRGERVALARWRQAFATEPLESAFKSTLSFSLRWGGVGTLLFLVSIVFSIPDLTSLGVGLMLPAAIILSLSPLVDRYNARKKTKQETSGLESQSLMDGDS